VRSGAGNPRDSKDLGLLLRMHSLPKTEVSFDLANKFSRKSDPLPASAALAGVPLRVWSVW